MEGSMEPFDFDSLRVGDVMQTDVYRLDPETPIEEALAAFEDLHISGAPVVDEFDHLVGVLSAYDVARPDHIRGDGIETGDHEFSMLEPEDTMRQQLANDDVILDKETYSTRLWGGDTVSDWMSHTVISVPPSHSVRRACRVMAREDIHRVFVIEGGRLLGVLSSFDLVRYVAGELEPRRQREGAAETRGRPPMRETDRRDLGPFERRSTERDANAPARGMRDRSPGREQLARFSGPRSRGQDRGRAGRGGARDVPSDQGPMQRSLSHRRDRPGER
jgi:CBS domain-containing protein